MIFSVRITNIGKTPAYFVHTHMDVVSDYGNVRNALDSIREQASNITEVTWTKYLLPGMSYRRGWGLTIKSERNSQIVIPRFVGTTSYKISGDERQHHTDFEFTPGIKRDVEHRFVYQAIPVNSITLKDGIVWETGSGGLVD